MKNQGVHHHVSKNNLSHGVTGSCLVLVTQDAERTMCTYLGATSTYSSHEIDWDHLKQSEYLYIEGYLLCSDKGTEAVMKALSFAREHQIKIALTCSDAGVVDAFRTRFDQCLSQPIDLLFCNELEALTLTQTQDVFKGMEKLRQLSKQVVITRSAKGAIVWRENALVQVPGRKVIPLDANGAGDMFAGAFIYGLTQHWDTKKAAEFACHCASEVIQVYGPRLEKDMMKNIVSLYS